MLYTFKQLFNGFEFNLKNIFSLFDSLYPITWTSQSIFPIYNSKYDDIFREHSFWVSGPRAHCNMSIKVTYLMAQ